MKRFNNSIFVTRPYLPSKDEFKAGIDEIWNNWWLTNDGPLLGKFHNRLAEYLQVPPTNMAIFNNGTMALEIGYHAMGLAGGEVITTPFTFVATSHALKCVGATPVFADVDSETLCLDPVKVEKLISPRTKAIVPVHVYGNICDIEGFDHLSKKYGIPIIYDAAHAFGVTMNQAKSASLGVQRNDKDLSMTTTIGAAGDMSMFSLHPTKLYHSCEGGILVFKDPSLQERLFNLRNFAITTETECVDVGTNAKMNELQALMGLCCLRKIEDLLAYRQKVYEAYAEVFDNPFYNSKLQLLPHSANKAYVPVLFKDKASRERVYEGLKKCNVFARRYFYPILTDFAPYAYGKGTCPIAESIADRVLTLPTYYGLSLEDAKAIAENVIEIVEGK